MSRRSTTICVAMPAWSVPGLPEHVAAAHALEAAEDVLQRVVEGVAHVERARHVRRRDHDRVRLRRPPIRPAGLEGFGRLPAGGDARLDGGGIESLVHHGRNRNCGTRPGKRRAGYKPDPSGQVNGGAASAARGRRPNPRKAPRRGPGGAGRGALRRRSASSGNAPSPSPLRRLAAFGSPLERWFAPFPSPETRLPQRVERAMRSISLRTRRSTRGGRFSSSQILQHRPDEVGDEVLEGARIGVQNRRREHLQGACRRTLRNAREKPVRLGQGLRAVAGSGGAEGGGGDRPALPGREKRSPRGSVRASGTAPAAARPGRRRRPAARGSPRARRRPDRPR